MSASLVGSEMCIRDSPRADQRQPVQGRRQPGVPPHPLPPRHQTHHPRPVSYTHLTLPTICSV
eukprot:14237511-Alexandrium_andersonii.AAC.1